MNHFAHSANARGIKHQLIDHLRDVAQLAGEFAAATRSGHPHLVDLAHWAGWLHDLGKYRHEFQDYLDHRRDKSRDTQHSVYGAAAVMTRKPPLPMAVAFAINGHHAGLDDWSDLKTSIVCPAVDAQRHSLDLWGRLEAEAVGALPDRIDEFLRKTTSDELLIRMLFSCLVDADYLDTERHFQGWCRLPTRFDPGLLLDQVQSHVGKLESRPGSDPSLRELRRRIFIACLEEAGSPPGLFSLTTPTGGGKTLASLAFALKQAEANRLRRVVVVIPFLSIIEQTARIYRDVLGEANVVEHHSAVVRERPRQSGSDQPEPERSASELAAENWDAPVIVTTAAQFLESLFARSPSRCRKLHNLARSVVIFDEVQTWPHHLIDPTLDVVRDLSGHYGASFVFCSATQPGFRRHRNLPRGFQPDEVHEIAPNPTADFATLNRVRFEISPPGDEWSWPELVNRIAPENQVLTIVNTRRHAVEVYRALCNSISSEERTNVWHLSSAMCPAHRLEVLSEVRRALKAGHPCRLVATQLIEAGVDVDFPVVYRALASLDALIQSAGRCNREGKMPPAPDGGPSGRFVMFRPAHAGDRPYSEGAISLTKTILDQIQGEPARLANDPGLYASYFDRVICGTSAAQAGQKVIQDERCKFNFETVAREAKYIEDAGTAVVVPYGEGQARIDEFRKKTRPTRDDFRSLQRYLVNLRDSDIKTLEDLIQPLNPNLKDGPMLLEPRRYDKRVGVLIGELPPEDLIFGLD